MALTLQQIADMIRARGAAQDAARIDAAVAVFDQAALHGFGRDFGEHLTGLGQGITIRIALQTIGEVVKGLRAPYAQQGAIDRALAVLEREFNGSWEIPVEAYANQSAVPEPLRGTSGAGHIRSLAELAYAVIVGEKLDQLDSPVINRTTVNIAVGGANYAALEYMSLGITNGKRLFVVFNATSDADAVGKLASPGQRYVIPIDGWREWFFEYSQRLTRIDFCSDAQSESNGSLVTWEYGLLS